MSKLPLSHVANRDGVAVAVMSDDGPTDERRRIAGTGGMERAPTRDEDTGEVRHPYRVKTSIERLRDDGRITDDECKAGLTFRDAFERGRLDPLRASSFERVGGSSEAVTATVMDARDDVARMLKRLGGWGTPAAQACWWVVGADYSIRQFAQRFTWGTGGSLDQRTAQGLVIAALNVLATPER
jgi:hypothetical protein